MKDYSCKNVSPKFCQVGQVGMSKTLQAKVERQRAALKKEEAERVKAEKEAKKEREREKLQQEYGNYYKNLSLDVFRLIHYFIV